MSITGKDADYIETGLTSWSHCFNEKYKTVMLKQNSQNTNNYDQTKQNKTKL